MFKFKYIPIQNSVEIAGSGVDLLVINVDHRISNAGPHRHRIGDVQSLPNHGTPQISVHRLVHIAEIPVYIIG